jgi:hypothetical protein
MVGSGASETTNWPEALWVAGVAAQGDSARATTGAVVSAQNHSAAAATAVHFFSGFAAGLAAGLVSDLGSDLASDLAGVVDSFLADCL